MGREKSRMEISTGMCAFHFHDSNSEEKIGSKAIKFKRPGTNGAHIFLSKYPFGNFGLRSFQEKISVRGVKIKLSIYIPSETSGFFWVNGKYPVFNQAKR